MRAEAFWHDPVIPHPRQRLTSLVWENFVFLRCQKAKWQNAAQVKRQYATASIVSSDRVVFNIKGNDYRLVVAIDYEKGIVWIKWIGTHKEYDDIDVRTVTYEKPKTSAN